MAGRDMEFYLNSVEKELGNLRTSLDSVPTAIQSHFKVSPQPIHNLNSIRLPRVIQSQPQPLRSSFGSDESLIMYQSNQLTRPWPTILSHTLDVPQPSLTSPATGTTTTETLELPEIKPITMRQIGTRTWVKPKIPQTTFGGPSIQKKKQRQNISNMEPAIITPADLAKGCFELHNQGFIPRNADISPAFDLGKPILLQKKAELNSPDKKYVQIKRSHYGLRNRTYDPSYDSFDQLSEIGSLDVISSSRDSVATVTTPIYR